MKSHFSYLPAVILISTLILPGCMKQDLDPNLLKSNQAMAPLLQKQKAAKHRNGEYIVVFKAHVANVDNTVDEFEKKHKSKARHLYKYALKGFAGKLSPQMLDELRKDPRVDYIEEDIEVSLATTQTAVPSWGLDRIDQRSLPLDGAYTYHNTGASVDAYIFDTGIRLTHEDFKGRVISGIDTYVYDGVAEDEHGHGTHVAGTVGGTTYGIAKNVRLIAVRVLGPDGTGSSSDVAAGFDWATNHHTSKPAVGNISLGGYGISRVMEDGVKRMIADGIVVCIAAGNMSIDAANFTPARELEAITVGASDYHDNFVFFSNFGPTVDVCAPGLMVNSAWHLSDAESRYLSGTSMAAPHAAGTAALYLEAHPQATPAEVQNAMKLNASPNLLQLVPGGTPNLLLNAVWGEPPPPAAPFAPALILPENANQFTSLSPIFSWSNAAGATSYTLQVSLDENFSSLVYSREGIPGTSASGIFLSNNTVHYWRVNASNTIGSSRWSATRSFTTAAASGIVPILYSPLKGFTNVAIPTSFTWSSTPGARAYRVQVSTNREFTNVVYNLSNYSNIAVTVSGLAPNTVYYWRVNANYLTYNSAWSEPEYFSTWSP